MAKIITDNKHYTDIAAAIREKNGGAETYKPEEMAAAVLAIETEKELILEDVYIEPTEEEQTVYPSDGYDGIGSVTVGAAEGGGEGGGELPEGLPEAYAFVVEHAKSVCVGTYSHIAVAENKDYIAVHFLTDDFELVSYDTETTEYTATGIVFVSYKKTTMEADIVERRVSESERGRFLDNWVWSEIDVTWNGSTVFTNVAGWYYNGVRLPKLPERDESTYPYSILTVTDGSNFDDVFAGCVFVTLGFTDAKVTHDAGTLNSSSVSKIHEYAYVTGSLAGAMGVQSGIWVDFGETDPSNLEVLVDGVKTMWSNYAILNADGSVYMAKSTPVEVVLADGTL